MAYPQDDIRDLEVRVADMEWQLTKYHEQLENALDHNADLQLNATWGILRGSGFLTFLGSYWLIDKQWRLHIDASPAWYIGVGIFFAAGYIWYWYSGYVERGFQGDQKKMWSWPKWDHPA